jgi:chorismate mutase/prephenate dehydratase
VQCREDRPGLWDLARDHFGAETPLAGHATAEDVIGAVDDGRATVGVLGSPSTQAAGAWWPLLRSDATDRARIISRLPFAGPGSARGPVLDAVAVARLPTEASGADRSFLALPAADGAAAEGLVRAAGLPFRGIVAAAAGAILTEIDDYLDDADPRLAALPSGARVLGAYAIPLSETGGARG